MRSRQGTGLSSTRMSSSGRSYQSRRLTTPLGPLAVALTFAISATSSGTLQRLPFSGLRQSRKSIAMKLHLTQVIIFGFCFWVFGNCQRSGMTCGGRQASFHTSHVSKKIFQLVWLCLRNLISYNYENRSWNAQVWHRQHWLPTAA